MNKLAAAIQKLMNAMRGGPTEEQIAKVRARYAPGVPFVITAANREWWEGKSGVPARGLLIDSNGRVRA